MRVEEEIGSWYEVQRELYLQVAREYIAEHFQGKLAQPA